MHLNSTIKTNLHNMDKKYILFFKRKICRVWLENRVIIRCAMIKWIYSFRGYLMRFTSMCEIKYEDITGMAIFLVVSGSWTLWTPSSGPCATPRIPDIDASTSACQPCGRWRLHNARASSRGRDNPARWWVEIASRYNLPMHN